jgi:hypothetical protein
VLTAMVTTLKGSTGVTGLATGGVYNNVPQNTPYPYVEVTAPTDRRQDTYGRFGASTLVDVKVVSQYRGDQEAARILDQCIRALDFQKPTMSGHTCLGISWEGNERFAEEVAGVVTRYHVATCRVWTEQSST